MFVNSYIACFMFYSNNHLLVCVPLFGCWLFKRSKQLKDNRTRQLVRERTVLGLLSRIEWKLRGVQLVKQLSILCCIFGKFRKHTGLLIGLQPSTGAIQKAFHTN